MVGEILKHSFATPQARDRFIFRALMSEIFPISQLAENIALIDPDLSISSQAVIGLYQRGRTITPPIRLTSNLESVALGMIISGIRDLGETLPQEVTSQHLKVVENIIKTVEAGAGLFDLQDQAVLDFNLLELLATVVARRPDIVSKKSFPWNQAIGLAFNYKQRGLYITRAFDERVEILSQAPEEIVKAKWLEHAQKGNLLDILDDEMDLLRNTVETFWIPPALLEVFRRVPEGNLDLTRSLLRWGLRVQNISLSREIRSGSKPIPEDFLLQLWQVVDKQWQALPSEHKAELLNYEMISRLDSIYKDSKETNLVRWGEALTFMDGLVRDMVAQTSLEHQLEIIKETNVYQKKYQRMCRDRIARFFPDTVAQVEAEKKSKSLWSKITAG